MKSRCTSTGSLLLAVISGTLCATPYANASVSDLIRQYNEDSVEVLALTAAPQVRREGKNSVHSKLTLPTQEKTLTFKDVVGGTKSITTRLVGSFDVPKARKDYLLLERFSKNNDWGRAWIVVNGKTGRSARLRAEPVLSPTGEFYANAFLKGLDPTESGISVLKTADYSEQLRQNVADADSWASDSLRISWTGATSFLVFEPIRLYDEVKFVETVFVPSTICEIESGKWSCRHAPSDPKPSEAPKPKP